MSLPPSIQAFIDRQAEQAPVRYDDPRAVPPQSDAYWTGPAGPGPSYLDADSGGQQNDWTTRNTVFAAWNILHLARMLKDTGGIPAYGNSTHDWDLDELGHPNPEYR